jgi:hypothetical protein
VIVGAVAAQRLLPGGGRRPVIFKDPAHDPFFCSSLTQAATLQVLASSLSIHIRATGINGRGESNRNKGKKKRNLPIAGNLIAKKKKKLQYY